MTVPDVSLSGIEFVIKGSSDGASSSVDKLSGSLNKLLSALDKIGKATKKAFTFPITQAAGRVSKFAKSLSGVVSGFKRILGYRMIRSVIRQITQGFSEGIKNLYGWSNLVNGKFAVSMDSISTSMLYLKNSIAAAVAPIVDALAPAIDFLIDKVVALINVINQLFALLTGAGSWTRATKKATEYGDAVSGAGGAAKEAMKYLAPFDELNRLPDDSKGGGGGGSGTDYSGMFETVTEFGSGIADFAQSIRDAIEAGKWDQVGVLLGQKINDIVNSIPWGELGTLVGEKINALFTTEYWTLKTIDFQNIGAQIVEFFNNAIAKINFDTVGGVIAEKMTAIPDIFIGAINNLNFKGVGNALGNLIKGVFNNLGSWFAEVNWAEFGANLANGIIDAIVALDISGIIDSALSMIANVVTGLSEGIGSAFSAVGDAIKEYFQSNSLWASIKNAFAEKWNNFANEINKILPDKFKLPTIELEMDLDPVEVDVEPTVSDAGWAQWKEAVQAKGDSDPPSVSAQAKLDGVLNELTGVNKPSVPTTANLNGSTNSLTGNSKPSIPSKANFNAFSGLTGNAKPSIGSNAYFNSKTIKPSLLSGKLMKFNSQAYVQSIEVKKGLKLKVPAEITQQAKASGGVFTNTGWKPVTSFAGGGSPYGGQIFRARENGNPELVGTLKGSTAVMNNDQIVASVSAGVARAIAGISFHMNGLPTAGGGMVENNEEAMYRAMLRALNAADREPLEVSLDGQVIYRSVVRRNRMNTMATGVNALA